MSRFIYLGLALLLLTPRLFSATPPNFLIILSDDQGYDDLSCHGNRYAETPRLDQLAAQSLEFTRFYVEVACAPTRASLLTGRNFLRGGTWTVHFGGDYLALDETTFAEVLRDAGYSTGIFGKWHNGKTPGYLAGDRGFQTCEYAELYIHKNNPYHIGDAPKIFANGPSPYGGPKTPEYAADHLANSAISFLRENQDKPFCLYLPEIAAHAPWEAPPELIKKYQNKGISVRLSALYALIEQMDTSIGRVLDELDTLGLAENTVVLFFSDNGYVNTNVGTYGGKLSDAEVAIRNVSNLRGNKSTTYEGGIRSPLMVRWPGHIKPGTTTSLGHVTDLFPTFLDLANIPTPSSLKPLDGKSLKPILFDPTLAPERVIFGSELIIPSAERARLRPIHQGLDLEIERLGACYELARIYARDQRFKLVKRANDFELFDMVADPEEAHDVKDEYPQDFARLEADLRSWFEGILAHDEPYGYPVYLIGRENAPGAIIHFNGTYRLTGDFEGNDEWAHSLSASKPGSSATFATRVITPGRYRVILQADVASPGKKVSFTAGENSTSAELKPGPIHDLGVVEVASDVSKVVFTLDETAGSPAGIKDLWNITLLAATN